MPALATIRRERTQLASSHLLRTILHTVDGGFDGLASGVRATSSWLRRAQTGFVRSYALTMLAGVVVILAALLTRFQK